MDKYLKSLHKNKNLSIALMFFSFMFVQLVILRSGNAAGRGYLTDEQQERVYCFLQVAVILGFLLHAMVYWILHGGKAYRGFTFMSLGICAVCSAYLLFSPVNSLFYLIITAVCVSFLGVIGGAVYYRLSVLVSKASKPGLCIGAGYAAAIALQYVFQLRWTVKPVLTVLLLTAFFLLFVFLREEAVENEPVSGQGTEYVSINKIICAVVITVAMLVFISYYNTYIHHLQIITGYTDYNVYSWPRLLMIPTVILFGFLGDIKGGKLLPLCTLCVAAIALLNTALLGSDTYLLNMCLYYVAITAVIAYYHVTFLRLADRSENPALWACMGRVIDSVIVIISFGLRISTQPQAVVLLINIAALAAVIITMALSGALNLSEPIKAEDETAAEIDPFPIIQESFGITPSELKVLRELVLTDDKQEAIAGRLNISVSTLRHHITSIYKKTGTQTRLALSKLVNSAK